MTLKECLISYVQAKKTYLKESTYVRYSNLIQNHLDEDKGKIPISDLTNKIIQEYCDFLLQNKVSTIVIIRDIIKITKKDIVKITNLLSRVIFFCIMLAYRR